MIWNNMIFSELMFNMWDNILVCALEISNKYQDNEIHLQKYIEKSAKQNVFVAQYTHEQAEYILCTTLNYFDLKRH